MNIAIGRSLLFVVTALCISSPTFAGGKDSTATNRQNLEEALSRIDSIYSHSLKDALKQAMDAVHQARDASSKEYDRSMAEFHKSLRELEQELSGPNRRQMKRELDSVSRSLRQLGKELKSMKQQHYHFHLDSNSVGPFHSDEITTSPFDFPELNIHIPEIKIPAIDIPRIEIPEMNEDISIGDSDESMKMDSLWPDLTYHSPLNKGLFGQSENFEGLPILPLSQDYAALSSGSSPAPTQHAPMVTKHYLRDGDSRYFINNPVIEEPKILSKGVTIDPIQGGTLTMEGYLR